MDTITVVFVPEDWDNVGYMIGAIRKSVSRAIEDQFDAVADDRRVTVDVIPLESANAVVERAAKGDVKLFVVFDKIRTDEDSSLCMTGEATLLLLKEIEEFCPSAGKIVVGTSGPEIRDECDLIPFCRYMKFNIDFGIKIKKLAATLFRESDMLSINTEISGSSSNPSSVPVNLLTKLEFNETSKPTAYINFKLSGYDLIHSMVVVRESDGSIRTEFDDNYTTGVSHE